MIDPREIRLGNLVEWDDDSKEIVQVESITKGVEATEGMYFINGGWHEDFNPVSLSEEWLVKLGFEKEESDAPGIAIWDDFYLGPFVVANHASGSNKYHYLSENGIVKDLNYVHELQNLYYFLMGEELTIKLNEDINK